MWLRDRRAVPNERQEALPNSMLHNSARFSTSESPYVTHVLALSASGFEHERASV